MVTKGIITAIDFNGNTCQVRIPFFETAGNDPITGTAIVSNTPGSYNGYKVGDVVLVAFEDGKMHNPVIIGKLYLGAAKEKQDPRGAINVETTTASKSASLPADAVLTANVDSNVPNTNAPFGSLASIANNLNSLNTDVNQLDKFTRNQFNSVITDVNEQGEQIRSEIKQTADSIEANVVHKHQDGSQNALGWDLTTDSWKINAQDTVNGKVKDINIVTIDRNGMSIAGDLKLNGYPKNIVVRYAQNDSDTKYPNLYNFKPDSFPGTEIDKTWYYNKYIKIIEADKEKYILISSENIDDYTITPGETVAYVYNLEEINTEWKTETPARVDGQYIWQWTHTESFSFNGDSWDEKDDDKVVCITGAKGEKGKDGDPGKDGAPGKDGYNTVTVMLYIRSKTHISDNPISDELYYKFSDKKLYTDDTCTTEYTLSAGWSYTISGAGDSSNGDLYCIAAIANSNTDSDSIPASEWSGPTLYVENGVSGTSVAQLTLYQRAASTPNNPTKDGTWTYNAADGSLTCSNTTAWNISIPSGTDPCYESHAAVLVTGLGTTTVTTWSKPAKFVENGVKGDPGIGIASLKTYYLMQDPILPKPNKPDPNKEVGSDSKWKETPDVYIDGYVYWLTTQTIYSDGHISYSDPVKDNGLDGVYEIAQGKSKNYYGDVDPAGSETTKAKMRKGDGWFDTAYHKIAKPTTSTGYLQKYIKEQNTEKYILITSQNITEYISDSDPANWPDAYSGPTLYQWSANGKDGQWEDVGGELIANKVTANYINALDITARKIQVNDDNGKPLFKANGIPGETDSNKVTIGGFDVTKDALVGGDFSTDNYCKLNILDTFKVGDPDNQISSSSLIIGDSAWIQKGDSNYTHGSSDNVTWVKAAYVDGAGTQSQQCIYNGITTYKCNSTNAIKSSTAGTPIISCMVLKPNKILIEDAIRGALHIEGDKPIPTVNFSTTLNLGIESPSDVTTTNDSQYNYIIASTPFKLTDFGKDTTIENIIDKLFGESGHFNQTEITDNLKKGIFTGYGRIQEYARATGPRSIGDIENLTRVTYPSLTTDHYIAIFMVSTQKNYFISSTVETTYVHDYDSAGNIIGTTELKKDSASEYTAPVYGYCCVPNSVEIALQALEIGTNFKVKTDGTMVANNAFVTGTLNIPDTAVIGGFNISKNTLTSSTLNINSNKVTISSYKPLILGKNFKLVSTPDTVSTTDASGEETTQEFWKSKISSFNPLEILGENSILISNTAVPSSTQNASILLETTANKPTSGSQVIRVDTSDGASSTTSSSYSSGSDTFVVQRPNPNIHFVDGSDLGGSVSTKYTTKATITATVYENSTANAKVETAKAPYSIKVYYVFDSTWYSTTLSIQKGATTASATVSASRSTGYPSYHGISKNSSSSASIEAVLSYPVSYTLSNAEITYTPKITANGNLTVEGNVYGNAFYASSDRELKTNIETINLDSNLDKFYRQLQPVKFNFKADLNAQHFGFIAQDLNDALSIISTDDTAYSVVTKDDKTGYYKVNYNEMVALNAAQIKNIMNYIKDLQSQYEALKLKYKELEEKINENR